MILYLTLRFEILKEYFYSVSEKKNYTFKFNGSKSNQKKSKQKPQQIKADEIRLLKLISMYCDKLDSKSRTVHAMSSLKHLSFFLFFYKIFQVVFLSFEQQKVPTF